MVRAALFLAIAALLCAPAHASSSCLDKNEAARTWPGRVLAIDDDGCWTYFRRGLKPASVDDSVNDRAASAQPTIPPPDLTEWSNTMAAMADTNPAVQATPWIDRWPDMIVCRRRRCQSNHRNRCSARSSLPSPSSRCAFLCSAA